MIKNKTVLEIEINGRVYALHVAQDAPLGEVFDVLCQMRAFVIQKIQEVEAAVKAKESCDG